ncbi:MAG: DNA mismatch repair protein MutS, partial [Clostridia bacterium]|nr:DNA mismatch repair protein MutS [Clostridia bacterium]
EYIASEKLGAKTLFATHYHELTEMEGRIKGVNNYHIAVKKRGDDITFLRRICKGVAEGSYGIEVAALAGVPSGVVQRAKELLAQLTLNAPSEAKPQMAAPIENTNMGQMSLLNDSSPVIERLKKLDVNTLTPIEALMELSNLAKMVE